MYRKDIRPEQQERWDKGIDCLLSGDGEGALFIYTALANDGCATALSQIGRIYEHGAAGIEQDFGESVRWYRHSIETLDDLVSHLALARIYLQNKHLDPNRELARYHLELLVENEVMGGQFGLGLVYHFGIGVDKDEEAATEWFAKAEALGHVGARLFRMKNLFLKNPVRYLLPMVAASVKYHWMYFFTNNPHRLEMGDDTTGCVVLTN